MFFYKKTRFFASVLLIFMVIFHILISVDAGFKWKVSGGARQIGRPRIIRPVARPPIIRLKPIKPPAIRLQSIKPSIPRSAPIKPSLKPSIVNLPRQPFNRVVNRPPVITLSKLRPKTLIRSTVPLKTSPSQSSSIKQTVPLKSSSLAMVPYKRPLTSPSQGSSIKQTIPLKSSSLAMVPYKRPLTSPSQGSSIKQTVPLKSSSLAMVPYKRPLTSPSQGSSIKLTVPLKSPSSIKIPNKPPETSQINLNGGIKPNRPNQLLITNKPTAPEQKIPKLITTNVQSQNKPLSAASVSNYPAWANPHLKPKISGSEISHSSSSSSLATKPLTSSSSLTPYKLAHNKPNSELITKPQISSSVASSSHVSNPGKPQINSRLHEISSDLTSGSLITSHGHPHHKPLPQIPTIANQGNTGSLTTSHGHPHHKPLPQTPSNAHQGTVSTSSHHLSSINEPTISSSHVSSASSSNSHPHHEIASAPITSTSQIQTTYPGANNPITNAANNVPHHPHSPVQVINMISNGNPAPHGSGMGHYGGSGMGQFGGSGMGQYGGSGLGNIIAESAIHSLVNTGIHKLLTPSEQSNFNYAPPPIINPDQNQQPQVPGGLPLAPSEGSSTIHNNYYVDPNAANVGTQVQGHPTSGQFLESGSSPGDYGSYQNPLITGNVEATNVEQPIDESFGEENGNLPALDEENGNLQALDEENGSLQALDEENGNLPALDEENGNLPAVDEENGNLPAVDEENGNLPALDEENGKLQASDEENGSLQALDEENGNLPALDEENGSLPALDEENGNLPAVDKDNGHLPALDVENGNLPALDEENGNLPALDEENGNLPALDEDNGNLPALDEENGNLPSLDEQNGDEQTFVEVIPVDNSELWELTETIFGYEANISQYINLDLQASEYDSVAAIEATKPLINAQEETKLVPTIKALSDLFDNYEDDPTKSENIDTEEEDILLDEFLKTDAINAVMEFLETRNYIAPDQRKETLQRLWMRRYDNSMSGFERIFLAEKSSDPVVFGGQNWIYFDHQEQTKRIKYTNYRNFLNLDDIAQLLKVNYQFDNVNQIGKAMLVGTSPQLEMALYTLCHYVRGNGWCTVSLANTQFGIYTHAWLYQNNEMLDTGFIDF